MNGFTTVERGQIDLETGHLGRARLTTTELRLLRALVAGSGEVVRKEVLLREVWGLGPDTTSRVLFATIERLRRKIERDPREPAHILTIGREGYAFRALADQAPEQRGSADPDRFVGRTRELASLLRALHPGAVVTIRGPGGAGKTRLARELCRITELSTGWCDLAGARSTGEIVAAISRALDLPLGRELDLDRHLRRVGRVSTARGEALLVLDNAEPVATELAALIGAWPAPRPALLATSRVALHSPDEQILDLEPLGTADAVALLEARATRWGPDWSGGAEAEAVVALLDGLPLAIELAARWARVLDPPALLERLRAHRLPLRAAPDDPRPERHRSLEAALRWSWEALDDDQRQALTACSVFEAAFTVDAAEAVVGTDALERLDELVERSLLHRVDGRFAQLESIRHFARERLLEHPDVAREVQRRHAAFFGGFGTAERMRRVSLGGVEALKALAPDLDDLRAAVDHGAAEDAARAALALAHARGALGPLASVVPLLERALARDGVPDELTARLSCSLGVARRHASDLLGAFEALEGARALARSPQVLATVEETLGTTYLFHGRPEDARTHLERALALHRRHGDGYGEAVVLADLAGLELRSGRIDDAAREYEHVLRLFRRLGARFAEGVYLGNLGIAYLKRGRFGAARASFEEALSLHRELGSARYESMTLCNLGLLSVQQERLDEATRHYQASLEAARRTGDRKDEGITLANLAWLLVRQGRTAEARRQLDAATDAFDELDLPLQQADVALTRSWLSRVEGDLDAALEAVGVADSLVEAHGFGEVVPTLRAHQGLVAIARGDVATARRRLDEGERAAEALGLAPESDARRFLSELREQL